MIIIALILISSCTTISNSDSTKKGNEQIILNYPVVLVHGIVAQDRNSIINFWGRIPDTLTDRGVQVFLGNTDAWGDYESNSAILKETIEKILLQTKKEKVNIIAHSKGGLDSRYLIWKYDFGDKVASLTTICTPHHGAEIADMIYNGKMINTKIGKDFLLLIGKLSNDINPNLENVLYQLTTAEMKGFNETVLMDNKVYYHSLYTTINSAFDDRLYLHTYRHIKKSAGANDGLVSETSARWGYNITKIKGRISHSEILDLKRRKISGIHIPDIYCNIVKELEIKGF